MKWIYNVTEFDEHGLKKSTKPAVYLDADDMVVDREKLFMVLAATGLTREMVDLLMKEMQPYEMLFRENRKEQ